jgi:uncharacterized protein (TIGR02145 family)
MKLNLLLVIIIISNCSYGQETLIDKRDGGTYKTIKIGGDTWMKENLNVDRFLNGDKIQQVKTKEEWQNANEKKQPTWCYFNFDSLNGIKYGKLYNGYAVADSRGLTPKGWSIPTEEEWSVLTEYLGGDNTSGKKMKSTLGWQNNGNGTNESGFSAMPGGYRDIEYLHGDFSSIGTVGIWWCGSWLASINGPTRFLNSGDDILSYDVKMGEGLSVRCIRD